ncbi:MAG: glycosyltransferase family 2 protein [Clostridia bacterium]|nr:glycosyltransferase family 2 protein [Clostridia bacterium]
MADNIKISAAIVTYNSGDKSAAAVASVLAYCRQYPLDLYIIDNNSSDDTLLRLKEHPDIKIIKLKKNVGFGAAHNKVSELLNSDYHFIINPDITVHSDVFADIVNFMEENPKVVMAAPKILNADGSEQRLPKATPTFKRLFLGRLSKKVRDEYTRADIETDKPYPVDFLSGCFFCIRTEAFRSLGGFDERYFMYLEDADLTARAKTIGEAVFLPQVSVTHLWARESAKNVKLFFIHLISCFKFLIKWRHGAK